MKRFWTVAVLLSLSLPLAAASDLWLAANPSETRIPAGGGVSLDFTLYNQGDDTAKSSVVTFDVPAEVQVRNLNGGGAVCDSGSRPVRCVVGDLAPHAADFLHLYLGLSFPRQSAKYVVSAVASSDTPDSNPANNIFSRSFDIVEATNFYVETTPESARVDPGDVVITRTTLSNFLDSSPRDVRIKFDATNGTIVAVKTENTWNCTFSDTHAECVTDALNAGCRCAQPIEVDLRTNPDRQGGTVHLEASASSSLPEFYDYQHHGVADVQSYRWFTVKNRNNEGSGSLRQAILDANAQCAEAPCKIAFEIDEPVPSTGYFSIEPTYPLPPITGSRVSVDATTQTKFSGDSNPLGPEVALDGHLMNVGRGIEIHSRCEAIVQGLAIGNFPDHGVVFANDAVCQKGMSIDSRLVALNHLGVDPTGLEAWPNLRGLYVGGRNVDVRNNVISGNRFSGIWAQSDYFGAHSNLIGTTADGKGALPNGASGIYLAPAVSWAEVTTNTISNNRQMGVAVSREAKLIDIRQNSMKNNGGIGIDVGLDGQNAPLADDRDTQSNAPVVLSALYDPGQNLTIIQAKLVTGPLGPYGNTSILDLYVNDGPDGDGEKFIGERSTPRGETFELTINGDYRGKWLNMTSTRVHFIAKTTGQSFAGGESKTSELSNSVLVQ